MKETLTLFWLLSLSLSFPVFGCHRVRRAAARESESLLVVMITVICFSALYNSTTSMTPEQAEKGSQQIVVSSELNQKPRKMSKVWWKKKARK